MRRAALGVALAAALAGVAAQAAGDAAATPADGATSGATIDWARGMVIVTAVGTADRRAPSPTVARVGAEREAEARAAARLEAAARALPAASGTVGAAIDRDDAHAAALRAAAGAAVELATDRLPDGSVRVRRGLPIEAVRQVIDGPRVLAGAPPADAPDDAPTAIVVDARKVAVTPFVGVAITDGGVTARLPALWVTAAPKDVDARLGARPARVTARALDASGALVIDGGVALEAAAAAGAAVIVVVRKKP